MCLQWKTIPSDQVMDSKLRCVFEVPLDKNSPPSKAQQQSGAQASSEFIQEETSEPVATELSQVSLVDLHKFYFIL